jgi:hypothetical protein
MNCFANVEFDLNFITQLVYGLGILYNVDIFCPKVELYCHLIELNNLKVGYQYLTIMIYFTLTLNLLRVKIIYSFNSICNNVL